MLKGLFQYSNIANKSDNVLDYILFSEMNAFEVNKAAASLTAMAEKSECDERIHYPLEFEFDFLNRKRNSSSPPNEQLQESRLQIN